MDKLSAFLIIGIVVLVGISSIVVYDTWISNKNVVYEVYIIDGNGGMEEWDECLEKQTRKL